MPVPDFESIMRPLLHHLSDDDEHSTQNTLDDLALTFQLTEEDRRQLLPSGKQSVFTNRVAWAKAYLKKAQAIENPRRGFYRITQRGRDLLVSSAEINIKHLQQYPEFQVFISGGKGIEEDVLHNDTKVQTKTTADQAEPSRDVIYSAISPEEQLERVHSLLTSQLALELLDRIKQSTPSFFEHLVVDLLLALGYGGSRRDAGRIIGKSGDEGIDGIISEDRLGLNNIYIQAKRWNSIVGRPEIQKFAGALQGQCATKGIFITTSSFTQEAIDFVQRLNTRIVLVTGEQLSHLMIEHNVGVAPSTVYEIKRIDSDYFYEEVTG